MGLEDSPRSSYGRSSNPRRIGTRGAGTSKRTGLPIQDYNHRTLIDMIENRNLTNGNWIVVHQNNSPIAPVLQGKTNNTHFDVNASDSNDTYHIKVTVEFPSHIIVCQLTCHYTSNTLQPFYWQHMNPEESGT